MAPDLGSYDVILVSSSGGKDSQAMLDRVCELAKANGVLDRVHVVHADLGRVEWHGTKDLARVQATHYGVPFHVVRRSQDADLLAQIEKRGMFPDAARRYCTSDWKRGPIQRLVVALARPVIDAQGSARVLTCLGIRAEESSARARKEPFEFNKRASSRKRHVDTWLPIFDWSTDRVWQRIRRAGTPHHIAYDLGMSRLSCCFCVFASRRDLEIAAGANPALFREYVELEQRIGHTFRKGFSLAEIAPRKAASGADIVLAPARKRRNGGAQ